MVVAIWEVERWVMPLSILVPVPLIYKGSCGGRRGGGGRSRSRLGPEQPHPTIWTHWDSTPVCSSSSASSQGSCLLGSQPSSLSMHGWRSGIKTSACSFLPLKFCSDFLPVVCVLASLSNFARYGPRSSASASFIWMDSILRVCVCVCACISVCVCVCVCRCMRICRTRMWMLPCPWRAQQKPFYAICQTSQQVIM